MKTVYVNTFLELWGAKTLQVIQMKNHRIRFAWNSSLPPTLIFESRVIFSTTHQDQAKNKTDERSSMYWTWMIYF